MSNTPYNYVNAKHKVCCPDSTLKKRMQISKHSKLFALAILSSFIFSSFSLIPVSNATVGNYNADYHPSVGNGNLSGASLSFSMSGYSSETDSVWGSGFYSIQINSNTFSCTINGVLSQCWVQGTVDMSGGCCKVTEATFQFWLLGHGYPCPPGYGLSGSDCWDDDILAFPSYDSPQYLGSASLSMWLSSSGGTPYLNLSYCGHSGCTGTLSQVLSCGSGALTCPHLGNQFGQNWGSFEGNVLGFSGSQANFNSGVKITVTDGVTASTSPTCLRGTGGNAAETNNLNLGTCTAYTSSIIYTES
jgi:hypothetical protein